MHLSRVHKLIAILAVLVVAACSTTDIKNEPGDDGTTPIGDGTVKYVCDRHDGYVTADSALDESAKASALADTLILRTAFKQEKVPAASVAEPMNRVISRHDAYVDADTKLSPSWKGLAKLQTRSLKRLLNTALGIDEAPPKPAPVASPPPGPASQPAAAPVKLARFDVERKAA